MIKLFNPQQPTRVHEAIVKTMNSGVFVKGPQVELFEQRWAERCGMKYAVAVSSGATALELVVQALFSDKQHSIAYSWDTFKAVPNAIARMGHSPVRTNIEGQQTIYAHHLHDQPPTFKPIIEDCSHCHGYKPVADTAVFSFFPTKILGAVGDAGIIVTNNYDVDKACRYLRNHGSGGGTNARMDEIQAAVLSVKLMHLDSFIKRRKEIVQMYDEGLGRKTPGEFHYAYCIPGSEDKKRQLAKMGVESAFYYTPEYMALPLHPFLKDEEVKEVISCVLASSDVEK